MGARNDFAVPRSRWTRSGFNNPSDYDDCFREEDRDSKTGELNEHAKRALLVFVIIGLGTPHQDESFLNKAVRTIDGGCDDQLGHEEGVAIDEERTGGSQKNSNAKNWTTMTK